MLVCLAAKEQLMFDLAEDATVWFVVVGVTEWSLPYSEYGAANWWEAS